MKMISQLTKREWLILGGILVVGIVLGLIYAWLIAPVEWRNTLPSQLRDDVRVDYLRMAIDSYSLNRNAELAITRYELLGKAGTQTLQEVGSKPGLVSPSAIQNFQALVESHGTVEDQPAESTPAVSGGEAPAPIVTTILTGLRKYVLPICGGTVLLGLALGLALLIRRRLQERVPPKRSMAPAQPGLAPTDLDYRLGQTVPSGAPPAEQPLATFRTIYTLGDDLYDDSFSIESPMGDFLGECGVGIGDVIGVGEPKKVCAFEVWLFDKNDIQTVTKVLMSRYAFQDEATRNRLAVKGDPVPAESGGVLHLETASLEVDARIVDLTYGDGALPRESFFGRIAIELTAWPR